VFERNERNKISKTVVISYKIEHNVDVERDNFYFLALPSSPINVNEVKQNITKRNEKYD
jgi:hypothetical protein